MRFVSTHLFSIISRSDKHTSNELPKMEKSFIKTSMHFSTEPYKIANIHLSKVASALHNPKGILLYARTPKSLVKGV